LVAFEEAMQLFHRREFAAAMPLFSQASQGPSLDVAQTAQMHARMCQQRLGAAQPPPLISAEDHYAYGLAMTNQRKLADAEKSLAKAAALEPRADHIHYALALARGLQGDYRGAAESLARAIEIQPGNRAAARTDADFHEVLQHSPVRELVYSEKIAGH
jgi:tetratricopeptide (TPR) repeat protein